MTNPIETTTVLQTDKTPHAVLEKLVSHDLFELPMLPETTAKLLSICNDQDFPPCELAEGIRRDQSIAIHVLRLANSAMFMSGTPVVSLQQAVARLGIHRIREIVLIVSCKSRVFDVKGFDDEVRQSFRSSLAAAVFAQEIARARRLNVEDAFLCGLLHDIGRPVLLQAIVDYQDANHVVFDRSEVLEAIELFRTKVGGNLIKAWNLPQRVADAVHHQRDDVATDAGQASMLLNLAIAFAASYFHSDDIAPETLQNHPMVDQLNLYPDQMLEIQNKSGELLDLIGEE